MSLFVLFRVRARQNNSGQETAGTAYSLFATCSKLYLSLSLYINICLAQVVGRLSCADLLFQGAPMRYSGEFLAKFGDVLVKHVNSKPAKP